MMDSANKFVLLTFTWLGIIVLVMEGYFRRTFV